jgi:HlyD family secretion protein
MSSNSSPILPLTLAALTAIGVAIGINRLGSDSRIAPAAQSSIPVKARWSATAQGRVEPKGGEVKLSALTPGRIEQVLVGINDKVIAGDMLVRIDDTDALARVLGAEAEAGVRKRERDTETNVPKPAQDRRSAEDKLNTTERAIASARQALDRLALRRQANPSSVTGEQMTTARKALDDAQASLGPDREALRVAQLASGAPLPTRLEAGLSASRAELSAAEAALERTRVRAPFDGTVLQVFARPGEIAAASPEQPMLVIGDLSQLRVRAEIEERDASKVQVGQSVVLRTDAYPDREFTGKVATVAQAMRPPKLAQRGPRRPNDLDTLEAVIDVDQGSALLPGMRVDVFFRQEGEGPEPPRADAAKGASSSLVPPAQAAAAPTMEAGKAASGAAN